MALHIPRKFWAEEAQEPEHKSIKKSLLKASKVKKHDLGVKKHRSRISKVKAAGKIATVLKEFKNKELHSGSKKGPKVTKPKQALAIAIHESKKRK